ncbi:MAG: hypothetical protein Q7J69_04220 [Candidatus Omnitrophota bacterium]|nr:hypothetical protein [Candidatus Omnitrophota bacterium]
MRPNLPLDELMTERGLSNADLVKASTEQLTFKMVQKARKGKPLTPNVQNKIIAALKVLIPGKSPEQYKQYL